MCLVCIEPRPDGHFNLIYQNLTLAVVDEKVLHELPFRQGQPENPERSASSLPAETSLELVGVLALAAWISGGTVEFVRENLRRVFQEH